MSDTVYVPKTIAKLRTTKIGDVLSLSFGVEALLEIAEKYKNEKGYLNLDVLPRKEVGQYGDTHSITVNTWKPEEKEASKPAAKSTGKPGRPAGSSKKPAPAREPDPLEGPESDIPF